MSANIIYVKQRPHFGPRQIRTLNGLHVGQKVIQCWAEHGIWALLEVKKIIGVDGHALYMVAMQIDPNSDLRYEKNVYLDQHSVIPQYGSNKWSMSWYLVRTKRKTAKGLFK